MRPKDYSEQLVFGNQNKVVFDNFLSKDIRAVDPDPLGSAFIVLPGSGSRRGKKKNIIN